MINIFNQSKINFSSRFKFAFIISLFIIFLGILFFVFKGPELGIDFKGGTELIIDTGNNNSDIETIKHEIISFFNKNAMNYSRIKSYGSGKVQLLFDSEINNQLISNKII